eukprot:TRINITY_DN1450_c0_g1_i3.p1 TRINITY_DN1450_c0_g1~~TRINITY_DN1450_c0_g1_i3.p1  ORF type:complete len:399 (-),score=87.54 TRINITY_DN1450_c0_g1_i3:85-1281(-)
MEPCTNGQITLTKLQCYLILSLSLLSLIPKYPFSSMFSNSGMAMCLLNYFKNAWSSLKGDATWGDKLITIERRFLETSPNWKESSQTLKGLQVIKQRKGIEDFRDCVQVNFADPRPGGTLPSAYPDIVQEEILFLIYPELFVTPLVVYLIDDREALVVSGVTRFNNYTGYQESFNFAGSWTKDTVESTILFMDAVRGGISRKSEFSREVDKAFIAFSCDTKGKKIATGNWGCGAFNGSPQYKAILQLIAAAEADRELVYTTFGTSDVKGLDQCHKFLVQNNITVGQLYKYLASNISHNPSNFFKTLVRDISASQKNATQKGKRKEEEGEEEGDKEDEEGEEDKEEEDKEDNETTEKEKGKKEGKIAKSTHMMPTRSKRKVHETDDNDFQEPAQKRAKL